MAETVIATKLVYVNYTHLTTVASFLFVCLCWCLCERLISKINGYKNDIIFRGKSTKRKVIRVSEIKH